MIWAGGQASVNSAVECTGFTLGAELGLSLVTENNWGIRACGGGRLAAATSPSARSFYTQSERAPAALVLSVRRFRSARVASGGWCPGVQWHGCLAVIVHFRCISVGLLHAGSGVLR